jgi:hypothetical protein
VSNRFEAARGRRRTTWLAWLLLASSMISMPLQIAAHDVFRAYVQHNVHLTIGARYMDLVLDLTFFEEWSARERALMDADANGRITRSELEAYLKKLAPHVARQVQLRVDGRALTPVPLYDPEVDLLGDDKVGPAHHRLRLCFFLTTPADLRADSEIVIEDRLWPDAKALGTLQAEGHDGCTLEAERPSDPDFAPARPGEARLFKFRCLKPPAADSLGPGRVAPKLRKTASSVAQ